MQILVNTNPNYLIKIGDGIIDKINLSKAFFITDKNIYRLYKKLIGKNYFCIEPGETSKTLETYSKILVKLSDQDTIVAFGGGVVGDIAGFIAATYKRGVKLINVPTTLLAMVDSSIGGKNGLNLGKKKNYIGTIYQPTEVIIDPLFLKTLSRKEWNNGFAEIIKYSYLFGTPALKKLSEKLTKNEIKDIIYNCCNIKAKVVEKDQYDLGYRHVLNFGHTIGHAIELLAKISHGEAISIGMVKELELGHMMGFVSKKDIERIKKSLMFRGLPTELPKNIKVDKFFNVLKADKKGKFVFAFSKEKYAVKVKEAIIKKLFFVQK